MTALILYFLAGVGGYAAASHLMAGLRQPRDVLHLLFAVLCLIASAYEISYAFMLQAAEPASMVLRLRANLTVVALFMLTFPWFIAAYCGAYPRRSLAVVTALVGSMGVANLVLPYTIQFRQMPAVAQLALPWGEPVWVAQGSVGLGYVLGSLVVFSVFGFSFLQLARLYRQGRRRKALVMMTALGLLVAFSCEGVLVRAGLVPFLLLFPVGFMALVFAMSLMLKYQLNRSAHWLQAIMDHVPAVVYLKDAEGRYLMVNRQFESAVGRPNEQVAGKTAFDLFPEEQAQALWRNDWQVLTSGRFVEAEEVTPVGGALRTYQTVKFPLLYEDGVPSALCGISTDVTERKQVEREFLEASRKLRGLYEFAPMGIALTDMQGRFLEFNPAFQRICGYTPEELAALDYWTLTPREYAEQEAEQLRLLAAKGFYGPYEKEYVRKDGSRVPLRLNGALIHGQDGTPYIWSMVEDISDLRQKEQQIWQQANFDVLTGLPNRRLFYDRAEHEIRKAERHGLKVALLFIDLDHFKEVNDSLGHARGDELLKVAATRIGRTVRHSDTVARLGGDEFAVVLGDFDGSSHLERLAELLIMELSSPFELEGGVVTYVSASVGITIYPDDAAGLDELIRHADQAMYAAKAAGRRRFSYFTDRMQHMAQEKLHLTNELRQAIARQELAVHFQPIMEIATGRVTKAEALLRWNHPVRGAVSPDVFVPLAEEFGLISELGEWVFRETLACIVRWRETLGLEVEVSVNMSPVQFENLDARKWLDWIARAGLPTHCIVLEITEGQLIRDHGRTRETLTELRRAGVGVSIDDFGTGFSSLSYLQKFDVDYLKIDRSFVNHLLENAGDKALTEAIVVMAHKLGIRTIAEGVETIEQLALLARFGCDYAQGFLFAPALEPAAFARHLAGQEREPSH
ncbi:MAG: EAL domain-containing protein [Betaproteobacteria bacterium]|nr:EAL domain-containing protein [Betaproteobacteria bacterium]